MLADLESRALGSARAVVEEANGVRAPGSPPLSLDKHVLGTRPAGSTSEDTPLVRAAAAATYAMGDVPVFLLSSTDANVPMARGHPGGDPGGRRRGRKRAYRGRVVPERAWATGHRACSADPAAAGAARVCGRAGVVAQSPATTE